MTKKVDMERLEMVEDIVDIELVNMRIRKGLIGRRSTIIIIKLLEKVASRLYL